MTATQYYITKPGGRPVGPYTIDELESMASKGELTSEHIYCVEGMADWLPISRIVDLPGGAAPVAEAQVAPADALPRVPSSPAVPAAPVPAMPSAAPSTPKPDTHMLGSVLSLLAALCLTPFTLPFALIALVQAVRADGAWSSLNLSECQRLAASAGFWVKASIISIVVQVVGVIICAIYVGGVAFPELEEQLKNAEPDTYLNIR